MKKYFFGVLCLNLFLVGCVNQRIIDHVQMVQVLGYDLKEEKVKGTVVYPTFEEQGKNIFHTLSTESETFDKVLINLNSKSSYPIDIGQLRTILFSKNFVEEQKLDEIIQYLSRDPIIGSRLQMGITEGDVVEVIKSSISENVSAHFYDKINQNIKYAGLPKMNLHLFLNDFYSEGKDPYLPYFILEDGRAKIDGIALFKKGKYINHINLEQSYLLRLLSAPLKQGSYETKIEDDNKEGRIFLRSLDSKSKYKIKKVGKNPEINIKLFLKIQVKKVPNWIDLSKEADIQKTNKIMEAHFNKQIEQLISIFQEYDVDPIGLGERLKANSRNWDYQRYLSFYPQMNISVDTEVDIIQTGLEE
ncbi:Ger(x)C family spore germination protein (plasmid) [Cytobacillus oceanisediminis]|uniref:Ger(x)C family spore germination protein n=1 Tax=Cytobacillus oceanisediminis TaxID=665099 RepID=UPI001864CE1E|nr:Ger(x)C family spore germination protein [Cytobacillus oceanisediminis]QOK29940.1 Ger(x)C family spore germination protein [Cytobacillus oceanisediminis]